MHEVVSHEKCHARNKCHGDHFIYTLKTIYKIALQQQRWWLFICVASGLALREPINGSVTFQ
jgi:hypothetical protein